jgi:two-component system, sporulation sensor kinase B
MEIILLFLPLVAAFLVLADFKDPANRWGSLALLFASLGGLYSLTADFLTGLPKAVANPGLTRILDYLRITIFFKTPLILFPVALLIFTARYFRSEESRERRHKPILLLTLLIPVVIMYIVPLQLSDFTSLKRFLLITDLWALPYMTTAYYFLYQLIVSANDRIKTERLLTALTIGMMSLLYIIAVYILPFYHFAIFQINPYLVICFLGLFSFLTFKFGFLGFKVSIGNAYLDNAIKTVSSEGILLNHHIKDELVKISSCADNIIAAVGHDRDSIVRSTQTILASSGHISNVVERLRQYLYQVKINPTEQNLAAVVDEAIAYLEPDIQEKALAVHNHLHREIWIQGDRFYLVEVLKNIFQNSLEAMKNGGSIQIDFLRSSKNVTLVIADTGCGIASKDLPHVLEPFYTTKDPGCHFGLGLSYCHHIMQQHGGGLEIESAENCGTTVFLKFPS